MQSLIIFILSGMLMLATSAKAEITYMNCKFNEGWHQQGKKNEDAKKMPDLTISMDKEKRRIKITDRDFEPYDIFKDSMRWSHKRSDWNDDYVLNTINGDLKMKGFNKKENWEVRFYYTCDKTQKKF
jgi:hypothetical protein